MRFVPGVFFYEFFFVTSQTLASLQAWIEGGSLLNQPLDNNRFVVLLCEIMCEVGRLEEIMPVSPSVGAFIDFFSFPCWEYP